MFGLSSYRRTSSLVNVVAMGLLGIAITSCSRVVQTPVTSLVPVPGVALSGAVHGGQQPVKNSTIQLYAVGTGGDGTAATALLSHTVSTDAVGEFNITGLYTCPSASSLVYIVSIGGDPGMGANNANLAEMAALGPCGGLNSSTFISISEVTTVASVFELFPYMSSYSKMAYGSDLSDMTAAFAAVNELANIATGVAGGTLPAGLGVPVEEINTLADIIASCVNTTGGTAGDGSACGRLASYTGLTGQADTIAALIQIFRNPSSNTSGLYSLLTPNSPFQPVLTSAPGTWNLSPAPFTSTPTILPGAGAFTSAQSITITDSTSGATIYYTVDGTAPTLASPQYSGAFTIATNTTVKAIAAASGHVTSLIATSAYTFTAAPAQLIISTAAGTGTVGYAGDGNDARLAKLNLPTGVGVDASGAVYVADTQNHVVRKFVPGGIITTVAGTGTQGYAGDGGQATSAKLNSPSGVVVDASGNLYIADAGNNVIRKVTAAGVISTYAGNGDTDYAGDGGQATAAALYYPTGVALDAAGDLFIADYENNVIRKVLPSGIISTVAGNGNGDYSGDGGLATAAALNLPGGVAVDGSGNIYIADTANSLVRVVTPDGKIATYVGGGQDPTSLGDGGTALGAFLGYPTGVATDAAGDLFIADAGVNVIRKVTPSGAAISTIAGIGIAGFSGDGGPSVTGSIHQPGGVAVDSAGRIFIADTTNDRVREVALGQPVSTTVTEDPVFTPAGGTYTNFQTVVIASATPAASIHYTTDGSTPSASSSTYTGPITVAASETIQAIAIVSGLSNSNVISQQYTINLPSGGGSGLATTTTLAATGSPGNYTLTATVQGFGSKAPQGSVAFLDTSNGNSSIGSVALGASTLGWTLVPGTATYATGQETGGIATGDFNGDGKLDVVTGNNKDQTISVLLGNGDGTFQAQTVYPTGGYFTLGVVVGDFNGDKKLDIVATCLDGTVAVFLGRGDGTFQAGTSTSAGGSSGFISTADLNKDGNLDLIVTNREGVSVSVLLGNGDGTFAAAVPYGIDSTPLGIAVGDYNGDGKLDLAVTNGGGDNKISILLGNGDGTFKAQKTFATGVEPYSIMTGDFNGDGKLDLAWSNQGDSSVGVSLGKGDGTFSPQVTYSDGFVLGDTGASLGEIGLADFNFDGKLDIVASNSVTSQVTVFLGKGDGTFAAAMQLPAPAGLGNELAIADFNGDGRPDVGLTSYSHNSMGVLLSAQVETLVLNGASVSYTGTADPHSVVAVYSGDSNYQSSTSAPVSLTPVLPQAQAPTFYPLPGTYASAQQVSIIPATQGTVYYTLDGSTPTTSSKINDGTKIELLVTQTLKAITVASGMSPSPVTSGIYTINNPAVGSITDITPTNTILGFGPFQGIGTNGSGNVYVSSPDPYGNGVVGGHIWVVQPDGTLIGKIGGIGAANSPEAGVNVLGNPTTIFSSTGFGINAIDTSNNFNYCLQRGSIDGISGYTPLSSAYDQSGVSAANCSVTQIYDPNAFALYDTVNINPTGYTFDHVGHSYISDKQHIYRFGFQGDLYPTMLAGFGNYTLNAYAFNSILALATDSTGLLHFLDTNVVRTIGNSVGASAGTGTAGFGGDGGDATKALLSGPQAMVFDNQNNLYIADTGNNRIRKVSNGVITTVVGNGTAASNGNGGAATSASISAPNGVAVDNLGNLYLIESGSHIRRVYLGAPTLAAPSISLAPGTYNSAQTVTITDSLGQADLYYTTDGSTPTTSSTLYTGSITVSVSETIKVIAHAVGFADSSATTAAYVITAVTPTITPATGTYSSYQTVTMSTTTQNASIYYTTDGSTPTAASTLYTSPISVTSSTYFQAIAVSAIAPASPVAYTGITIHLPQLNAPIASPNTYTGTSATPVSVTLSAQAGASIYYTTDGSAPTTSSTLYTAAFNISGNTTLKAIAVEDAYTTSSVATYAYSFSVAYVNFSPTGGSYSGTQTISLSSATTGATIYYTTDGSTPTTSSSKYAGGITVSATETIKAFATLTGYTATPVNQAAYTITAPTASTPVIAPNGGTFTTAPQVVGITGAGGSIYYTLDGSTPTAASTLYTGNIILQGSATIKAIQIQDGYKNSSVAAAVFTINLPAIATPTFSLAAGTYPSPHSVVVATTTPGTRLYYTTDGSTPTTASTSAVNSVGIEVPASETVKVLATKNGYASSTAVASYTISPPPSPGIISTFAGGGTDVTVHYVGLATGESIAPYATATDASGNVYIADGTYNVVRKVTPSGQMSTYAGTISSDSHTYSNIPATSATFTFIAGLAVDAAGDLFILDNNRANVRKVTPDGNITTVAGNGTPGFSGDGGPGASAQLYSPISIAVDAAGNLYISDEGNYRIREVTTDGIIHTVAGDGNAGGPDGGVSIAPFAIAVDSGNNLYFSDITDASNFKVRRITSSGTVQTVLGGAACIDTGDGLAPLSTCLGQPTGLAFDKHNNLYIAQFDSNIVQKMTPGGTVSTVAGSYFGASGFAGDGGSSVGALLNLAQGVAVDPSGNILIADYGNARVRKVTVPAVAATPVFTPLPGTYTSVQTVSITSTTDGASIFYTTDGSTPTSSSTPYTGPIAISSTKTLLAIAIASGYTNSDVAGGAYTINLPAATAPLILPAGGTYSTAQTVTISSVGPTFYTLDGSTPTTSSTPYTHSITVSASETIKAITSGGSYAASPISTASYVIVPPGTSIITSISAIAAKQTQTITITGSGFGTHAAYSGSSFYISLWDDTNGNFEAGYGGDSVGLVVTSWTNTQIVLQGYDSGYGGSFVILNGDHLRLSVWNAQVDRSGLFDPSAGNVAGSCSNIVVGAGATTCQ